MEPWGSCWAQPVSSPNALGRSTKPSFLMGRCQGLEEEEEEEAVLGSAPTKCHQGACQGWAHPSRALQVASGACWIDFSPWPSKESRSLDTETCSLSVIAFHWRGLKKSCFSNSLLGFPVVLVLTRPCGTQGGGWQTCISILVLGAPCCMSAALPCGEKHWSILGLFNTPAKDTNPLSTPLKGGTWRGTGWRG